MRPSESGRCGPSPSRLSALLVVMAGSGYGLFGIYLLFTIKSIDDWLAILMAPIGIAICSKAFIKASSYITTVIDERGASQLVVQPLSKKSTLR